MTPIINIVCDLSELFTFKYVHFNYLSGQAKQRNGFLEMCFPFEIKIWKNRLKDFIDVFRGRLHIGLQVSQKNTITPFYHLKRLSVCLSINICSELDLSFVYIL